MVLTARGDGVKRFPLPVDVRYDYADRYGEGSGDHRGTDIFSALRTPLYAVIDGVAHPDIDPKGGIVVYLSNEDGSEEYYYAHLDDIADGLRAAQYTIVSAGDLIGYIGRSGNAAGGAPHLHFQARINGKVVDPYILLRAVDPIPRGSRGPFPKTPKPTADSVPPRGPFKKGGGAVLPEEPSMGLWGIAVLLGAYLAWKTFGGGQAHG